MARGPHHVVDPDIQPGGNLMFPSISHLFLHWWGKKSIAKLDGAMAGFVPPWIHRWILYMSHLVNFHPNLPNMMSKSEFQSNKISILNFHSAINISYS